MQTVKRVRRRVSIVEWAVIIGTLVVLAATALTVVGGYLDRNPDRRPDGQLERSPASGQEPNLIIVGGSFPEPIADSPALV